MANFPHTNGSNNFSTLRAKNTKKTLDGMDSMLKANMRGDYSVLKSGWKRLNHRMLGGFFFGQIYLLAGASGHGKSIMLNQILRAFMTKTINSPKFDFLILHFGFEMSSEVEMMRRVSSMTKIPMRKFMSVDDVLSEEEYEKVKEYYSSIQDDPILFFETPGTRYEIEATIRAVAQKYPDKKLVVSLDHSLLVNQERGEDEIKTLAELGKMLIILKKELGIMGLILGQLNDKIESEKRRDPTNPSLHYPTKTDIHGSKQLYHASDAVLVVHQPAQLNLEYYGPENFPTKDLVVVHILKNRNGEGGYTLFDNHMKYGYISEKRKAPDQRVPITDAVNGKTNRVKYNN